jgi:hypothetical protein
MIEYITEIQRQLVENYGFQKGDNGCPQNVPDGAYPMIIDGKLDLVCIVNGGIWCCNFVNDKGGLKAFQSKAPGHYAKKPNAIGEATPPEPR